MHILKRTQLWVFIAAFKREGDVYSLLLVTVHISSHIRARYTYTGKKLKIEGYSPNIIL